MKFMGVEVSVSVTMPGAKGEFRLVKSEDGKVNYAIGPKASGKTRWIREQMTRRGARGENCIWLDRPSKGLLERTIADTRYDVVFVEQERE